MDLTGYTPTQVRLAEVTPASLSIKLGERTLLTIRGDGTVHCDNLADASEAARVFVNEVKRLIEPEPVPCTHQQLGPYGQLLMRYSMEPPPPVGRVEP